ncbi:MAG: DNA damage-inducible protein D, partial [Bacilli bacterium]|nr:DNA damage-inducible protein D [Bacilli bacterium]
MINNLIDSTFSLFESIKHIDDDGNEFWYARELMTALNYKRWDKFKNVIDNSIKNCKLSNVQVIDHFSQTGKMVEIGSGTKRELDDYKLSRYACYLIAQNSDPRKEVVALAKTYFAIQTRKQELLERDYNLLSEDEKRIYNRNKVKHGNSSLNKMAYKSGVRNFETFTNAGYKGLYNGET